MSSAASHDSVVGEEENEGESVYVPDPPGHIACLTGDFEAQSTAMEAEWFSDPWATGHISCTRKHGYHPRTFCTMQERIANLGGFCMMSMMGEFEEDDR